MPNWTRDDGTSDFESRKPLAELDAVLDEALGWFEAYRRIGFTPDEIRFGWTDQEIWMVAQAQGCEFRGICGARPENVGEEEILRAWAKKGDWWNRFASKAAQSEIYFKSFPARNAFTLLLKLKEKGFQLPIRARVRPIE